jgi:AcrR family transcriptional regulator
MASTQDAPAVEHPLDGRLARSVRTRRAIVDALRSLHHDGDLRPTAPRVAERAGVSVRTVWQHFTDLESLLVEAGQRDYEIAQSFVERLPATLPLDQRIAAVADQRARMFEAMAPPWRAARLHEPFSAQIRSNRDRLMRLGRDHVEASFAPELEGRAAADRAVLVDALQLACSWAAWEGLRADLHLGVDAARAVVVRMLTALLHDP